jgi:23S rRNA (uridine2479-2'-O)-methyltransferase
VPPPRRSTIRSPNDEFQLVSALLTNRKQRRRQRSFVVHGVKPINVALEHRWSFESVWTPQGRELSRWARHVVASSGAARHVEVAPTLFAQLAAKTEPGELIAVLNLPADDLSRIELGARPLLAVCDRPASPGNLGSIIRSAYAFGADGVVVTGHAADVYDPQTIRASLGALFATPAVHEGSPRAAVGWLRETRPDTTVIGTSAKAETPLERVDLTRPVALVFGNEADGLSSTWFELCDELATIPIGGALSSLNVAAAASIFLNETRRQRYASR